MSVRNQYPLIGTIIDQIKKKRNETLNKRNMEELLVLIDNKIRRINFHTYSKCKNYIVDARLICRTYDGKEFMHTFIYKDDREVNPIHDVADNFVHSLLDIHFNESEIRKYLPKLTRYLYMEFTTSYGEVYYTNKVNFKKIYRKRK